MARCESRAAAVDPKVFVCFSPSPRRGLCEQRGGRGPTWPRPDAYVIILLYYENISHRMRHTDTQISTDMTWASVYRADWGGCVKKTGCHGKQVVQQCHLLVTYIMTVHHFIWEGGSGELLVVKQNGDQFGYTRLDYLKIKLQFSWWKFQNKYPAVCETVVPTWSPSGVLCGGPL